MGMVLPSRGDLIICGVNWLLGCGGCYEHTVGRDTQSRKEKKFFYIQTIFYVLMPIHAAGKCVWLSGPRSYLHYTCKPKVYFVCLYIQTDFFTMK